jgi:hypothetical protein
MRLVLALRVGQYAARASPTAAACTLIAAQVPRTWGLRHKATFTACSNVNSSI